MLSSHLRTASKLSLLVLGAVLSLAVFASSSASAIWYKTIPLPAKVRCEVTRTLRPGSVRHVSNPKPGFERLAYRVELAHGRCVSKELIAERVQKPVDGVMLLGQGGFASSRSMFRRSAVRTMIATGYPAHLTRHSAGRTCTGRVAGFGCIAVDPRRVPLGTLLYVEGYGLGLACDRGSAIKGNRIDLCFATRAEADRYGRRPVRVHFLVSR